MRTSLSLARFQPQLCAAASFPSASEERTAKVSCCSKKIVPAHAWKPRKALPSFDLSGDITKDSPSWIAASVPWIIHRRHACALKRLEAVRQLELKDYEETRNHPEASGTSRFPWLHFGNIGR